ncbi:dipeptidyl aminopeptidase/acylaminoacyl peptidase [Parabacteroides sp. PFB2-12]|uniref:S9 family peptidase n=1 Tax=unclassified Parabacteroides TaxID=2649774 RepID=UPI0024732F1A|nr:MULTISPECIES: prolyl oligopeptidase family serine peptidase [unclassified Parabacteroides]MDH6341739.1 dipeptidyl aminopeptidase/acylaminoacyl peptidase [Parabacteroides sp. PM6-13]MDH6389838.1 dipeptidyl aminopeptidase/acylaminoacyl peptidase [Parabacteroides sp. PFB2-12]
MKAKDMRTFIIILFFIFLWQNGVAQSIVVDEYIHYGSFGIRTPLMNDPVDLNKKPFDFKSLISQSLPVAVYAGKGEIVKTDNEGRITISSSDESHRIGLLTFYMDAPVYCTPELQFEGLPDIAELYLNGKIQALQKGSAKLTLEPIRHELVIKYIAEPCKAYTIRTTIQDSVGLSPQATTNPSKRYSIYEVVNGRRIQSARISPDGKYYFVRYYHVFPDGKREEYAELIEAKSYKQVRTKNTSLKWMPASNLLYYVEEGAKGIDLITVNPATLQEKIVASGLPTKSFTLSPTEDFIIYSKTDNGSAEKNAVKQVLHPDDRSRGWRNRSFLYKYDLQTGVSERLTFGRTSTGLQDISPDGRYLLFSSWNSDYTETPFIRSTFCLFDLQKMKADTLLYNDRHVSRMAFSPDGKKLSVLASADAFDGLGRDLPDGQIINSYDKQLYLYDIATGLAEALTKEFDPSVKSVAWNRYDNLLYVTAEEGDKVLLYTIHPEKKRITPIKTTEEMVSEISFSSNSPDLIYYGVGLSNTQRLYSLDLKKRQERLLHDVSAEVLENVRLGEAGDWSFISSRGDSIPGRYYLPVDFDATKKYPMITYYYGGTNPTTRRLEGHYAPHVFAGMGFVVYVVQPRGSTGYGQELSARHVNDWGKKNADEIIEGVLKFCEEHPFVDKTKLGCVGASYGGFMTMYLQTVTDIFAAAVSHAGISNISAYWGEGLSGHSYSAIASAGNYPWNAEELYAGQSPLYRADKINTPLLLLHGTADTNVPTGQSYEMFMALKMLGKETALVVVDGENHGITNHANRIRWSQTMYAWFNKWLKDRPEWWEALYPEKDL